MEELNWRKSSYSSGNGGNCVELAPLLGKVATRDSKHPTGPSLHFSTSAFTALTTAIKREGE
ncbi:DUF397 domain-containing protein [Actinocorallia sp. A-T 12471]|uniref:DUF397 domain-containing protein n=1 Tax=Actinocorallia sp. A-T 12471 TaxID=3089813 RepID=UPI0029CF0E46|nr:DUF397 domain-containing protein [Actinocorallia sp. A-T 12471]MDX6744135.1 DUF397 domain-containing protein [Actinocorallia sp. A-T 12471]